MARLPNENKHHSSENLVPPHDQLDQPINGFPQAVAGIGGLVGRNIDPILTALEMDTDGTVSEEKASLRMAL